MAGSKSNYLSKKFIDEILGGTAFSAPATVYAALWTASLDDTSTGATAGEASYTSYTRFAITNNTTEWPNATGGSTATKSNANAMTFPTSTGGTSTVIYFALLDSATIGAGNILFWSSVASATVNNGDTPKVNASGLTLVDD